MPDPNMPWNWYAGGPVPNPTPPFRPDAGTGDVGPAPPSGGVPMMSEDPMMSSLKQFPMRQPEAVKAGPPGKVFVDRIEDNGMAVLLDGDRKMNHRAMPGWKEGMYVDPPKMRQGVRKRRAVP